MGETIAIACSFIWSLAVICFKLVGEDLHPSVLNFCKNWLGAILLIPTVLLIDGPLTQSIPSTDFFILIFSGVLGIGLADFFVLKGLSQINASKLAIVECAYSPFVIFLSVLFLGENFTIPRFIGTSCVLGAVFLISTSSKSPHSNEKPSDPIGILWCLAGILSMAIGIVIVKPLFESVPLFWVIQIRLAAGAVGGSFLLLLVRNPRQRFHQLFHTKRKVILFLACFLSTYVSMILWIAGYKYNDATVTAVLNQTATLFTVLFAAIFLKEKLTAKILFATGIAVAGVLLIILA